MSATAVPLNPAKAAQAPMQVLITGKVTRVRRYEAHTLTTIISPAPDAYSKPDFVEIRSARRFAEVDEVGSWMTRLGGYEGKAFRVSDPGGESRSVVPVNLYLNLVE